jgi:hypothetical protein
MVRCALFAVFLLHRAQVKVHALLKRVCAGE